MVGLHRLIATLSMHHEKFGRLVKGTSDLIIQDGQLQEKAMRENAMSREDVIEDLRLNGKVQHPSEVKIAYMERNGDISVIPKKVHS